MLRHLLDVEWLKDPFTIVSDTELLARDFLSLTPMDFRNSYHIPS